MRIEIMDEAAVLRMEAEKANAVNPEFLRRLNVTLDEFRGGERRGLVITGHGRFFCAGLDLTTLFAFDRGAMRELITNFDDTMMRVFGLSTPVVCAINGHAIAGGCVLALQGDERYIADDDYKMGLNEAAIGVGLPTAVIETLRVRLPASSYVPVAVEGKLFTPKEAKDLGFVDGLCAPDKLESVACARARQLAATPEKAFRQIKRELTLPVIEAAQRDREARNERWLDTWFDGRTREILQQAVDRLKSK